MSTSDSLTQHNPTPAEDAFADIPISLNPFAKSIRPVMSDLQVAEEVRRLPLISGDERKHPGTVRQTYVLRLDDYVEPLPRFFDLQSRISAMIRAGYARRNPLPLAQQRSIAERMGLDSGRYVIPKPVTIAPGSSLIGFSGVGKTTAVGAILQLHQQIHTHASFEGFSFHRTQLVWLRVACPPTGGARSLLINIFQELDKQLGTDYQRRYENPRYTAAALIPLLVEVLHTFGVGILVIDEIQRLVRLGIDESGTLLDVFTHLRSESQIPVLLVGTPKAMRMLNSSFEQARRNTSMGNLRWHPMNNDETWAYFVECLWQFQWLETPTPFSPELKDALHFWSQGITDLAVKIFKLAQFNIIGTGNEKLTPELFGEITRTEFEWFPPWIPHLQRRTPELMNGVWDDPFDASEQQKKRKRRVVASAIDLSAILVQAGVKPTDMPAILAAVARAQNQEEQVPPSLPLKESVHKKPRAPANSNPTLWEMVKRNDHLSGYDTLIAEGVVRLPTAFGLAA